MPSSPSGGAAIYGVSCDSPWAQSAFKEKLGVSIEQLSDFEPKGAACSAFGVLHAGGFPERALVITGPDGSVRWSYQADSPGELPQRRAAALGHRRSLRRQRLRTLPEGAPRAVSGLIARAGAQAGCAKLRPFGYREKRNGPPTEGRTGRQYI